MGYWISKTKIPHTLLRAFKQDKIAIISFVNEHGRKADGGLRFTISQCFILRSVGLEFGSGNTPWTMAKLKTAS